MPVRRLVARAPLHELEPVFAAIRERAGVREEHDPAVVADAVAAGERAARGEELPHVADERADLTAVPFVTIDPEGSTDLDQALHLERTADGWSVLYAIADVGAHVEPGSALDRDTRDRAETVYCPDMRIGLHPAVLSEGFASLLPDQRTKAAVWSIDVDLAGQIRSARVERAWVRSVRQHAYTELSAAPPAEARELVQNLAELGAARRALMRRRGAVTLPKPSQEVTRTAEGLSLEFRAARDIEEDNAQVSLLAGQAAAMLMMNAGIGILRTMPPATTEAMTRLRRQAKALGVRWRDDESYADMLDHLDAASPQGAAFLVQAVTLFRGARWEPFDVARADGSLPLPQVLTHGALATPYAHVTAPLRRLVDRFGLEICLAVSAGRPVPEWVREALPTLGDDMAGGVRRNAQVDRECVDAVESAVLAPHVGEVFEGIGLDERTVQLNEPAVVARCEGDVAVGRKTLVRLVSAEPGQGPRFAVAS